MRFSTKPLPPARSPENVRFGNPFGVHWESPGNSLDLGEGEVHVWLASLDLKPEAASEARKLISPEEATRLKGIVDPGTRSRLVASRAVLRSILAMYTKSSPRLLQITDGEGGKPQLAGGPKFNLSHSGGLALYAFSADNEVGVDIERVGPAVDTIGLASRFLSEERRALLMGLPTQLRRRPFYKAWTEEEALLKGMGRGLSFLGTNPPRPQGWSIVDLAVPTAAVASLAFHARQATVKQWLFPESALSGGAELSHAGHFPPNPE
jgi:4'-phosphopantetheinyl transferase